MTNRRIDLAGRGVALEVLEVGAGSPKRLLLVHGFAAAKEDFAEHLDALADLGWHAVAPDLRGHGASDHPPGLEAYSFATMAEDLEALLDALGWDRAVVLGHSIGGALVQHLALRAPHRLAGLVLMESCHTRLTNVSLDDVALGQQVVAEGGLALLHQLQQGRDDPTGTPAHTRLVAERSGYAEFGDAKLLACSPDMWRSLVGEIFRQDDRLDALRGLTMPTLVIVGEQDAPFYDDSVRMAEAIPGATLAVIADAGHSPQFENPDAWWAALSGFLAQI